MEPIVCPCWQLDQLRKSMFIPFLTDAQARSDDLHFVWRKCDGCWNCDTLAKLSQLVRWHHLAIVHDFRIDILRHCIWLAGVTLSCCRAHYTKLGTVGCQGLSLCLDDCGHGWQGNSGTHGCQYLGWGCKRAWHCYDIAIALVLSRYNRSFLLHGKFIHM